MCGSEAEGNAGAPASTASPIWQCKRATGLDVNVRSGTCLSEWATQAREVDGVYSYKAWSQGLSRVRVASDVVKAHCSTGYSKKVQRSVDIGAGLSVYHAQRLKTLLRGMRYSTTHSPLLTG